MTGLEQHKKTVACIGCLRRKEKIDAIERYYLMWEASIKHCTALITELKYMKDELDLKIEDLKDDFNTDFTRCL